MVVFFLTSALMVMAVLAIRFFFKNKLSFLVLYPLWGLVLLRLLLPVNIIESPISIINLTDTLKSFNNEEILTFDAGQKDISGTIFLNTNNQNTKNNQERNTNININKTTQNNKATDTEENKESYKENTKKPKTEYENQNLNKNNIMIKPVIIIWISGSTVFFIFVIISNVIFYKKLKTSRKHVHTNNKGIPVYISNIVNTPCLTGVLHPAVYLPSYINNINLSSDNMQDMYLKQILSHEYTHIKHKDHIWALMRMICLGVYWFNPFVWIAAFYSKQDAELACDEAVLKNCTDDEKYNYGKMLLVISQKNSHNKLYIATSLGSSKSNLKERITMITKKRKLKKRHIALITSLSIILAGCGMTSGTTTYNNISNTIAAKPTNMANSETPKPPKDDKRIKAFEKFMQGDILSRPEWRGFSSSTWHEFNAGVKDLYFSIQYTKENIPCLFVTSHTSKVSGNTLASSYAMVYYYDQDSKRVEFLTYMACSSSGESVSIKDGLFITNSHHSYSTYNFTLKDNKNTVVLKIIEGYYMAEGYDNNYTYTKYQWTVPVDKNKIKSNIYKTPLKKYADVTKKKHYNVAKAIRFEEKCMGRTPVAYYKNTPKKWEKFYKDGHIKDSFLYPSWSGNIDKKIIKSLKEIKKDDFAKAVDKSYTLIGKSKNKTRMSYCGKLSDDILVYYLNTADYASAILIYDGNGYYHAYDTKELKTKNLDLSAVPADFGTKTTTIDSINTDVDNDGEDETVFYIYVADKFYVIDYYYDYSYKDYNIVSSHIMSIGTFEKDYSGID